MEPNSILHTLEANGLALQHPGLLMGKLHYETPVFCGAIIRSEIHLGAFTYATGSGRSEIWGSATIGRYCSIAPGAIIGPPAHPTDHLSTHPFAFSSSSFLRRFAEFRKIHTQHTGNKQKRDYLRIDNDVWIGQNAIILRGLRIGHGSVIAAGSVVTSDVDNYSIVGGVPARLIRKRFDSDIIERLLALEWWNYDLAPVREEINYSEIEIALQILETSAGSGRIKPLEPKAHTAENVNGQIFLDSQLLNGVSLPR
jgi:acetyltransferase-like isoleucine patch superfamily enzyme